ncbi:hypothetical protein T459_22695 [Capsicum annuum]|uniref:F-box associated domain-containing protein n=1 Tax=Capsicum annuum TaxID=4072 RepID=A0A2G2YQ87_CAPAN|nr:hypothetical protein T459_22695 [Capsicum annuum]
MDSRSNPFQGGKDDTSTTTKMDACDNLMNPGLGCVFWSLNDGEIQIFIDRTSMILYFDVKLDEVKNLSTPNFVCENDFFYLTSVKGCLSLYSGRIETKELDICIMEQDGSWKWLLNITIPVLAKPLYKIEYFLAAGEMVTLSCKYGIVVEDTHKFYANQMQVSSDYKNLAINLDDARMTSPLSLSLPTICL